MEVVKVSAKSVPKSVAGAIAAVIRENGEVEVQAVGAGASNQAVKAIAISRSYMALSGVDLVCIPAFTIIKRGINNNTIKRLILYIAICHMSIIAT